jgi:predicted DNA-binding protein
MQDIRRVDIIWSGEEVKDYDRLKKKTEELQRDVPSYVKEIIKKHLINE